MASRWQSEATSEATLHEAREDTCDAIVRITEQLLSEMCGGGDIRLMPGLNCQVLESDKFSRPVGSIQPLLSALCRGVPTVTVILLRSNTVIAGGVASRAGASIKNRSALSRILRVLCCNRNFTR